MSQKTLNDVILNLRKTEKKLLELGMNMLNADNGTLFPVDLIAIGAMKRTASNTEGFITLIETKNMISARALLRIQIDTFMRFSALWLVDSPHDLAKKIIDGKHIRNIKDKAGNKMTDGYLSNTFTEEYPWVRNVYRNLSGYVHFSSAHLFNAVENINHEMKTLNISIGKEDIQYPEWSWLELVDCFIDSVNIFFKYLNGWIVTKEAANKNEERNTNPKAD
jgi:hypothetical protein